MSGEASSGNSGVDGQLDDLLSLVMARSRGEVGNDAVENALSSIVSAHAPSSSEGKSQVAVDNAGKISQSNKDGIIPDEGNYDDDSEDEAPAKPNTSNKVHVNKDAKNSRTVPTKKKMSARKRTEALEEIPLGKMGERMIITFGDGPCPDLEVISSVLLGTRASLQRAVLDARALRRQLKDNWHHARAKATMHLGAYSSNIDLKKTASGVQNSVTDSALSFRAMDGFGDNLRKDLPCGFDVGQLETLFPEEMGAYQRWKKMHNAYEANAGNDMPKKPNEDDDDDAKDKSDTAAPVPEKINSARLVERLANFDARTNEMGGDSYMNFADVRRGSFLPRRRTESGETKPKKKRGRPANSRTTWQHLNSTSIIFVHWIGFDPRSALSPPNDETTHALGFLAYDFLGKLVEKAVSLRLEKGKKAKQTLSRFDSPLLELPKGDHLEKGDIERALAEVNLDSLYCSSDLGIGNSANIAQLYFGPGFEERLELEMDEIFGTKAKSLTQEEMKVRKEEEIIFSALPEHPSLVGMSDLQDSKHGAEEEGSSSAKKSRRGK